MYELQVENMSCGHCIAKVSDAVRALDMTAGVEINLADKKVMVDSSASLDEVKAAIVQAGYPVTAAA
ncbi:heavy-metal-associated domain-containing protein [Pseudoduganella violacea]|uniref:Copper chaperone n=1 Tax=Pseudoduganella violacea TaxID=1715466 RepID=A0A7W5FTJ5_9BURK|nr:cation transporter [Pseudoduganella violacea]MBB3118940.1 copper chaperone [Pseudoduganella violacea]